MDSIHFLQFNRKDKRLRFDFVLYQLPLEFAVILMICDKVRLLDYIQPVFCFCLFLHPLHLLAAIIFAHFYAWIWTELIFHLYATFTIEFVPYYSQMIYISIYYFEWRSNIMNLNTEHCEHYAQPSDASNLSMNVCFLAITKFSRKLHAIYENLLK